MFGNMMRYGASPLPQGYDDRYFSGYHPMMGWMGGSAGAFWAFGILWIVTWILVIIVLIVLIRWLWKKGDKVR